MFRKNRLIIYFCVISLVACRHLDNTVSDAITKQKPVAAMLNAEPGATVQADIKPTNINQILPTMSSRDAASMNATSTVSTASIGDSADKTNTVESKGQELTQPSSGKVSDLNPTQDSTDQQTTEQVTSKYTGSGDPVVTPSKIDTYFSIKRKGKRVKTQNKNDSEDFKKEHAHIEASAAAFSANRSKSGDSDKGQTTDPGLPYDKLNNVNIKASDNSPPVVQPVLNHLDNDKVNKIESISTVNGIDSSPAANSIRTNESPREEIVNKVGSNNMTDLLSEDETKDIVPTSSMEKSLAITTGIAETKDSMDTSLKTDEIPTAVPVPIQTSAEPTTAPNAEDAGEGSRDVRATPETKTDSTEEQRDPDDVDPLDIFVDDIKYQRFPDAMSLTLFKEKIAGQTFKKLYILESSEKKLFQHVRQLEVTYDLDGNDLYAEFLFRFIYSRQCTRIERFKLGTLSNNSSQYASFEKEVEGDKTERLVFFSQRPNDYVFFMSCTDMKTSPYACRDTFYVTLDSKRDPPNQFPWLNAAQELESQMNLNFQDPRFIFNFVMMPCARE